MTERVIQNFRGTRALVAHRADANRERLTGSLQRLGLKVDVVDETHGDRGTTSERYDVVFFDADADHTALADEAAVDDTAWIALIGVEAPSRLTKVVRRGCCGYLVKPIRASGVYTALFVALNEHQRRRGQSREQARLIERVQGRRVVTKAILKQMRLYGVDDDEAYRRLREQSMRLRISLEAVALRCLQDDQLGTALHEPQLDRRSTT